MIIPRFKWLTLLILLLLPLLMSNVQLNANSPNTHLTAHQPQGGGNVELIGQIGGSTKAVFVEGDYAYIGVGPRLAILDITNPASPTLVGQSAFIPGVVEDIYVSDNYAYLAAGSGGLRVVDISTPTSPTEVGFYEEASFASGVYVSGNYAYLASDGLRVLDISTPSSPTQAGFYDSSSFFSAVYVSGNYAYLTDGFSGLSVVDISTPTNPTEIGFYQSLQAIDVYVSGNYAYLVDRNTGLVVVDISTPSNPTEVGFYDSVISPSSVTVSGNYAYLVGGGLRVVDISNPTNPTEVGFSSGSAQDVYVFDDYAYLADSFAGLRVVSISEPSNPTEVGFYDLPGFAYDVNLSGNHAYLVELGSGLSVVSISELTSPTEVGFYDSPGSAQDVYVFDDYAFLADSGAGLRVVSISEPTNPTEVGFYNPPGSAREITLSGGYAYLGGIEGLRIVDISNLTLPTEIGFYDSLSSGEGLYVSGNYAYFNQWVVDISEPTNPTEVGSLPNALGVTVSGNYAYLANGDGLKVMDILMPTTFSEVGFYDSPGSARGVYVSGNYAYLVDGFAGLRVVDISTPSSPTEVGFYDSPGEAWSVTVSGDYIYLADGAGGLLILQFTGGEGATPTPTQAANATPTPTATLPLPTSTPTVAPPPTATPLPTQEPWVASYPFADGFEGNRLGRGWSMLDDDDGNGNRGDEPYALGRGWTGSFTAQGAVSVREEAAYAGNAGVLLDDLVEDDIASTAALVLTIDLAGQSDTELSFWWREFNDENDAEDGVFISDDWGATWRRIFSFNNGLGEYRQQRINLDAAALAHGLTFNDHFQIKFQFFDNHPYPNDGYAIDEVRVEPRGLAMPTPVATDAYEEDDSCGAASSLTPDGTLQAHTFHDEADADWIKFEANQGITYTIEARVPPGSQADLALELYNACDDNELTSQDHHFAADVRLIFTPPADGTYYLHLRNHEPSIYGEQAAYTLSVRDPQASAGAGALILVAGKLRENDPVQPNIHHVTNAVYNYARANGCSPEQIYYLASEELDANGDGQSDVDAIANNSNLQEAITEWAIDNVGPDEPLTIYMMDHGGEDALYLDGLENTVTAQELDGWLTQLEGSVGSLSSNVIVEACYSGSFISPSHQISRPGRAIITSTGDSSLAYASNEGAVFSDALLNALAQGMNLQAAFGEAQLAAQEAHPDQTAWLDDTADGLFDASDGQLLAQRGLACAAPPAAEIWPPNIFMAEIRNLQGLQGEIFAEVRDDKDQIALVSAIIYPPSYTQPDSSDELQPEPEPILLTPEGNDTYRVLVEQFNEYGTYRILLYAQDEDGLTSRPYELTFERLAETTISDNKLYLPMIRR